MHPSRVEPREHGRYRVYFGERYVDIESTGERNYSGLDKEDWFAMYLESLRHLPNRPARVVDAGSGSGYGADVLAHGGYAVVGVDQDLSACRFARLRAPGAWIIHGDLHHLPRLLGPQTADAIVAIESLEHVRDDEAVLRGFHEVLAPDGHLFVSTPDADLLGPEKGTNPYHVREYTWDELVDLLIRTGFNPGPRLDLTSLGYRYTLTVAARRMESTPARAEKAPAVELEAAPMLVVSEPPAQEEAGGSDTSTPAPDRDSRPV